MNILEYTLPHGHPFAEKWSEWLVFRKDLKKPYKTQKGVTMALNQLREVSEQDAIEMINNSMRQEYQGIFPLKKNPNQKEETDTVYTPPKEVVSIPHKTPEFDRAQGISHLRKKLKANFENGSPIFDFGDVYTVLLKDFINIPGEIAIQLHQNAVTEATRPRNRFEDRYVGNVTSDVRDSRLNWMLTKWREEKREIWKEI